jgi:hypothetical protein
VRLFGNSDLIPTVAVLAKTIDSLQVSSRQGVQLEAEAELKDIALRAACRCVSHLDRVMESTLKASGRRKPQRTDDSGFESADLASSSSDGDAGTGRRSSGTLVALLPSPRHFWTRLPLLVITIIPSPATVELSPSHQTFVPRVSLES